MASSNHNNPLVTPEEFKAFHTIDRTIFTRLVFYLSRDPAESMQVIAFWLWLEQENHVDHLIYAMTKYPYSLLNTLADEAVFALACIGSDVFVLPTNMVHDIPLTQRLTRNRVTLSFILERRDGILGAVTKLAGHICIRAFDDLLQQALLGGAGVNAIENSHHQMQFGQMLNKNNMTPLLHFDPRAVVVGGTPGGDYGHHQAMVAPQFAGPSNLVAAADPAGAARAALRPFDFQALSNEISDVMNRIVTPNNGVAKQQQDEEEEDEKGGTSSTDNRTIFLTFSKGYRISEEEVRDFFVRKHGDECIEAVNMQDVASDEQQPLFARLVVPSPGAIPVILEGKGKAKFTINGKHVWARKYIKKHHRLTLASLSRPPHGSGPSDPPPPPPPSPATASA